MDRFTIIDIARIAGVSQSTVSRVLNDRPDVSEKTRQRVLKVIKDLDFSPDEKARRLVSGKSRTIAVLHPIDEDTGDLSERYRNINYVIMGFMYGVAKAGEELGYFFNLFTKNLTEDELLGMFRSSMVDGVILMQVQQQDWRVDFLREHDYPFVMIGRTENNAGLNYVDNDFETSIPKIVDFLVRLGHRHIGFLTFSNSLLDSGYTPAVTAWRGYQNVLDAYQLPTCFRNVGYDAGSSYDATVSLLDEHPEITAIAVISGQLKSIISGVKQKGLRIPEDISIVAVAALDEIAQLITPELTNIPFPSYEMGYQATHILVQILNNNNPEVQQILNTPDIVVRESTGIARGFE